MLFSTVYVSHWHRSEIIWMAATGGGSGALSRGFGAAAGRRLPLASNRAAKSRSQLRISTGLSSACPARGMREVYLQLG